MKKMTGFVLALAMAVSMVLPGLAVGIVPELEWGMTQAEITAVLGEPSLVEDTKAEGVAELDYTDRTYGEYGYPCTLGLGTRDDALFLVIHLLLEDGEMEQYSALAEDFTAAYGESGDQSQLVLETIAFMNGIDLAELDEATRATIEKNLAAMPQGTWKDGEGSDLILLHMGGMTGVIYLQPEE